MNEQKQIEEIQAILPNIEVVKVMYGDFDLAKLLYDKGVRKITNNSVVLTREEYERLLKEETLCERLGNDVDMKLKYIYELEDKVAQERKETAEKIVNDISSDILIINTKEYGNIEVVPMERLQEICNNIIERN